MIYNDAATLPDNEIEVIEKYMLTRLGKTFPFMDTDLCPQDFTTYEHTYPEGIFLTRYINTTYESINEGLIKATHTIQVFVIIRDLFTQNDAYKLMGAARNCLCKLSVPGAINLVRPISQQLLDREVDRWYYTMDFEVEVIISTFS